MSRAFQEIVKCQHFNCVCVSQRDGGGEKSSSHVYPYAVRVRAKLDDGKLSPIGTMPAYIKTNERVKAKMNDIAFGKVETGKESLHLAHKTKRTKCENEKLFSFIRAKRIKVVTAKGVNETKIK